MPETDGATPCSAQLSSIVGSALNLLPSRQSHAIFQTRCLDLFAYVGSPTAPPSRRTMRQSCRKIARFQYLREYTSEFNNDIHNA